MSFDFKRRLIGLQNKMEELDLDLVVYGSCQNFQYLTGLLIDWRHGIDLESQVNNVFVPLKGEPIVTVGEEWSKQASEGSVKDVRTLGEKDSFEKLIRKVLSDLNVKGGKVGIGDHVWGSTIVELTKLLKNPLFIKAESLLDRVRVIKDSGEIEKLRKVATLTDKAVETVVPNIKEGATQKELRIEVERKGKLLGATDFHLHHGSASSSQARKKQKTPQVIH